MFKKTTVEYLSGAKVTDYKLFGLTILTVMTASCSDFMRNPGRFYNPS